MRKTSEWLLSNNTQYHKQITDLLDSRKNKKEKSITVSVTGGKGGVGKTSVSLKLSKELAKQGFKVLLIDCDYNLSNTALKLGLPITNTFYDLVSAKKDFDDCLYKEGNFNLLSACNGSIDLFDASFRIEDVIIDIINAHEDEYDYIFLDCPAGITREALTLNAYCDQRIVVVTPDKSSITDSYSLVKMLSNKFGVKENQLLVNKYRSQSQYEKVVKTLSETIENFLGCRTHILGGIKELDIDSAKFDEYFLSPAENSFHKNFLKVVDKYSDQTSNAIADSGILTSLGPIPTSTQFVEQEVQVN
jgi:flagellar biosynthesis protein FlhG